MKKLSLFFIMTLFLINIISSVYAVDIVYDDFEDGNLNEWSLTRLGTANYWASSTTNPYQGTSYAQSQPTYTTEPASVMQRNISTSGYENIIFKYYKRNIGLDVADEFQVEYYNGTGWTLVESTGGASSNDAAYVSRSYSLPSSVNNNPNFAIKFECTAGATSEYCRIDNVNISGTLISCVENLQNTSWSDWINEGSCIINDLQGQVRNRTQYDANNCGYVNTTFYEYQNISCNYCSYNVTNSSLGNWYYLESCDINDLREKQRNKTEYDSNYASCYAITGLSSDLWNLGNNITYFENSSDNCDYCSYNLMNTTKSNWYDVGICNASDNKTQTRNWTEYDYNYPTCYLITNLPSDYFANITFFENQTVSCDYCTPNLINTTKSEWINLTCSNEQMNQSRNWIQYDSLNCVPDNIPNITYFEYQLVQNYQNTSWSNWQNVSCLSSDTMNQTRNLTQYDSYVCALNQTFYEYRQTETCDFCTPNLQNTSWTNWENQGSCLINDIQMQNRSWIEYDINSCGEIENITYWEYQNISCDFCIPNLINTTKSNWYFTEECQLDDLRNQQRNWTQYDSNDCGEIGNQTFFENENVSCDFLTIKCEIGGPYQQGALVLFIGNVTNSTNILIGEDVDINLYKNNELNLSRILQTSEDGDFETSFSNLSVGNYQINADVSYLGANETCTDSFQIGNPASLILDKTASIHNISNNEIFYNISLRILNIGGSDCINLSLNDVDYGFYDLGKIVPGEIIEISYLMNFTRQNTTTYYELSIANVGGIDSYSNNFIFANSSYLNLTIPSSSYSPGKQTVIIKNIIYSQETRLNVTYNISVSLYNSGDEDLENINYIDSDFGSGILLNLGRGDFKEFSNLIVIDKAASNIQHEFALGSITIGSDVFYSNRPKINIPGYGGPADLYVYVPTSVIVSTSLDSVIEVLNMNPDIGQDFVIDYWITNINENLNYSSGQKTIYISALGDVNTSISLVSPLVTGNYKLKAIVSWAGGTASAFDSFEVVSEQIITPPAGGGGGGGGGRGITMPKNETNKTEEINNESEEITNREPEETGDEQEIICNFPYIRYGKECCLDENNNNICDEDEPRKGITGLFVRDSGEINFNYPLFSLLLLLSVILFITYKLIRRLLLIKKRRNKGLMRIRDLIKLKVYTEDGVEIGKIVDLFLGKNKIDSLKIKFTRKMRKKFKRKGIVLNYKNVKNVREIVIIDRRIRDVVYNITL